jgi:uncharacterized protein (TIGR01777 family)
MKVVVSGAGGLIGTALCRSLAADGHELLRLVRRPAASQSELTWDPQAGKLEGSRLEGVDAVVHLAGAGVGDHRWTSSYKREIRDSRVLGTRTLVHALRSLEAPPKVLVSASAVGIYGDRGDEIITEVSAPGTGFLVDVTRAWEAEAQAATAFGIRVVTPRTGLVIAGHGGAFAPLIRAVRLFAGGPLGNGQQWWPWITLADEVAAIRFLIDHDLHGPVNLTAPAPERNGPLIRALARALHRPAIVPAPAFALRIVLGEFADDVLGGQRAIPEVLIEAGFEFEHPTLAQAIPWLVESR